MSIYNEWMDACARLRNAKEEELLLRNAICMAHLEDVLEGSKTTRSGNLKITATANLNRSVNREVLEAIYEDLTDEEKECIDFKPSLRVGEYKRIEGSVGLLAEAITIKPAQSTLKIVEEV